MPAFYKIDKERRLVISTGAGILTMAEILAHQSKLANDSDFEPGFSQLMDFNQVTQIELSGNDIRRLAQRSVFSPQSRRAFIMPNDVTYGLGRMYEILREAAGEHGIGVFRNLEGALDWILSRRERA